MRLRGTRFGALCLLLLVVPRGGECLTLTPDLQTFISTLEQYVSKKNDIVFVLDESGSIGAENFPAELTFTEVMSRLLVVSQDYSRLSVITFSNDNKKHIDQIADGGTMCGFVEQVNQIPYRTGGTRTKEALEYASQLLRNARPRANRIIVLISDGQANSGSEPNYIASALKSQGIVIFAVGVASINRDELEAVATSERHIYMLRDFAYIKQVNSDLRNDIRERQWDAVAASECLRVTGQCDSSAICACTSPGGTHRCVCKAGYEGDGTLGNCHRCPRGKYKDVASDLNCKACPANSTTAREGATSEAHCSCEPGYEGDPGNKKPCSRIKCAALSGPTGGSTLPQVCGNSFGDECNFLCKKGHCPYQCDRAQLTAGYEPWNRKAPTPRVCQADKTWSGSEFFCEKVRCPALQPPANGNLGCSNAALEYGTTCTAGCNVGYNITGDTLLTCVVNGTWTGKMPTCEVIKCPPLKVNAKLQVSPSHCMSKSSNYDSLCQYQCKAGWSLADTNTKRSVDGVRKCLENGTWLNGKQSITCLDAEKPVIVSCTKDMVVPNNPGSPFAHNVSWPEPTASDNSNLTTVELVFPPEIRSLPHNFPIGEHEIKYVAKDSEGLESEPCTFKVFVEDIDAPEVVFCPEDIIIHNQNRTYNVTWEEPKFVDNGPGELKIVRNRESGSSFSWGPPSTVTYLAKDAADNDANCSFAVIVKPYPCPYVPPPKNGFVTCDSETDRQFCSVYCDKGYDFVSKPEALYRCKQTAQGGQWSTFSRRGFKFPWPDCAVSKKSKQTDLTVDFTFATNSCNITEERKAELRKKFFEKMSKRLARYAGMCEASRGCTVDNVAIDCEKRKPLAQTPRVHRRDLSGRRRFVRRQAPADEDEEEEFGLRITFTIPLGNDFNATQLIDSCSDCKNTSLVHPSAVEATAITQVLEEASLEAANSTVAEILPEASFVETTHSIKSVCERGLVSNGLLCVNCPLGTFYGNETTCLPCPIGTYSDREAAESCLPCPANKTTLAEKASSESECRERCKPGTWSTTGKAPCTACAHDSYQDESGQSSCKKCAAGLSTGRFGADSQSSCKGVCEPGTYSWNGLMPCDACSVGQYQPASNQTSCLQCDAGLSTQATGSTSEADCIAPDQCERLNPCASGATCVDEPGGYRCACPAGLSGKTCTENADDCAPGLCQNGGTCVDGLDSFSCRCPPGYVGSTCEIDEDDCASGPCLNGATCIDGVNGFACKCAKGFTGKRCEATFHDCATMPCLNGGSCFESVTHGFRCCCPKGFSGKKCELVQSACSPNPCENNGTCLKKGNDVFECTCAPGFEGDRCERDVDDCASQPCLNGGTCVDEPASFSCHCHGLYEGPTCAAVRSSEFSLNFPNATVLNFAKVSLNRYLRALTLSFLMKTTQSKERGTVVSYAFVDPLTATLQDNALAVSDPNKLLLYIFGESFDTKTVANDGQWHSCAVTWDSTNGQWVFYWDRQEKMRGNRAAGGYLFPGVLVVGQDQDDLGSAFSGIEAYSGHVAEINLWDYAMSSAEIQRLSLVCGLAGNVVSWPEIRQHATKGIVSEGKAEPCRASTGGKDQQANVLCHDASNSFESRARCSKRVSACSMSPCQNGQACVDNDDGSSECQCDYSYEGRYCQYDMDECLTGRHNCSHICVNEQGSYKCGCPQGMFLSDDGVTCLDTSYCSDGPSTYLDGESWERDCKRCSCSSGVVDCSPIICPSVTCESAEVLSKKPAQCCPSCVKEPSRCTLLGNKTLTTFDGLSFTLSPNGEYTMFEDCHYGNFYGYVGFAKSMSKWPPTRAIVRVYIHCLNATLYSNGRTVVDGRDVQLPHREDGILSLDVPEGGDAVRLRTHHGLVVTVHSDATVVASLPDGLAGKACGLCGNANGLVRDDLTTRHHISAKTTEEFLASWRMRSKEEKRAKHMTASCSSLPHSVAKNALGTCKMIWNNQTLKPCLTHLKHARNFFESCVEHMCSCHGSGRTYCYCDSFAAFKLACEQLNMTFHQLPGKSCEMPCPPGMEFRTCGPANAPRCSSLKGESNDLAPCVPGCYCPAHQVWHKGKCIEKGKCPAEPVRQFWNKAS